MLQRVQATVIGAVLTCEQVALCCSHQLLQHTPCTRAAATAAAPTCEVYPVVSLVAQHLLLHVLQLQTTNTKAQHNPRKGAVGVLHRHPQTEAY